MHKFAAAASVSFAMAAQLVGLGATPALALDDDCACIVSAPASGASGMISIANGTVFLAGPTGNMPIGSETPLIGNWVVTTGESASAQLVVMESCQLAIESSTRVWVSMLAGNRMCVRVSEDEVAGSSPMLWVAGGGALGAGAAVLVSLGLLNPVSK